MFYLLDFVNKFINKGATKEPRDTYRNGTKPIKHKNGPANDAILLFPKKLI